MARNTYYRSAHWQALKRACHQRDRWRCIVPGCTTPTYRLTCDHIETRPNVDYPTPLDVMSNTRTLCHNHDVQHKEGASGKRKGASTFIVKGADASGNPIDPNHPWNR